LRGVTLAPDAAGTGPVVLCCAWLGCGALLMLLQSQLLIQSRIATTSRKLTPRGPGEWTNMRTRSDDRWEHSVLGPQRHTAVPHRSLYHSSEYRPTWRAKVLSGVEEVYYTVYGREKVRTLGTARQTKGVPIISIPATSSRRCVGPVSTCRS